MTPAESWLMIACSLELGIIIGLLRYALAMRRIAIRAQQDAERLELEQSDIALGLTDPRHRRRQVRIIHPDEIHLATRYGRKSR